MHKHIIYGLSATGCLRQHLREPLENFAVFEDLFIVGPLSSVEDEEKFIAERSAFWDNNLLHDDGFYPLNEFIGHIKKADCFTLWLLPGAHDQIMWAWLVHLFELYKKDWENVQVKHLFNKETSQFPYITSGELRPQEFALCQDFKVTDEHLVFLQEAYKALIHDTPEQLLKICNRKKPPLPELQTSLKAYLKIYPDKNTGLSIFDKALLAQCRETPFKSARIVGGAMMHGEYEDRLAIGDVYLFNRLVKLSQLHAEHPLIHLDGTVKNTGSMRFTEVKITDLGKAVLAGDENQVALNGIEEQIGGVRLSSKDKTALWFYDNGNLVKG